jgi:hypothetical protein
MKMNTTNTVLVANELFVDATSVVVFNYTAPVIIDIS